MDDDVFEIGRVEYAEGRLSNDEEGIRAVFISRVVLLEE